MQNELGCYIMDLNDSKYKPPEVEKAKQELESDDIPLELLEHEKQTIKVESIFIDDIHESSCPDTLEPKYMCNLKSETFAQDCHVESGEKICIKQELLHEELDIKNEDEAIQKTCLVDNKLVAGIKHFKCNICDYTCKHKPSLKTHLRTHTGEKPFECSFCASSFRHKNSLKIHLSTHTGEKPFNCNICDYSCNDKCNLKRHLEMHNGEKPYKCNFCEYSCGQKSHLNCHLRTHTGEKPFKCNVCVSSFGRRDLLKLHLRTHTGEKPFTCTGCSKTFTCKASLKRHMLTHSKKA